MNIFPSVLPGIFPPSYFLNNWMIIPRNMTAYKLAQFYGRTPAEREIDIAELQEAWNKANPQLIPLVVDGMDNARTEEALRGWLTMLRVNEYVISFCPNPPHITPPATMYPVVPECIITYQNGIQTVTQSKL